MSLLLLLLLFAGMVLSLTAALHQATKRRRGEYIPPRAPARPVVPEMHTVRFLRLPFGTFVKLSSLLAGVAGLVIGLASALAGICGVRLTVDFFDLKLRGAEAIIAAPFLCPLIAILCALILSPLAWPLTNWLLRRTRGLDVTGTIANLPVEENSRGPSGVTVAQ